MEKRRLLGISLMFGVGGLLDKGGIFKYVMCPRGDIFFVDLSINVCHNPNMNEVIQIELEKLKEIIVKTLPIEQIYLFGSYAYGTPQKDSDIDLFIVLKDEVELREIDAAIQIRLAISEHQTLPLDLIVAKKSQYLKRKTAPTLERKIAREGILLYAA